MSFVMANLCQILILFYYFILLNRLKIESKDTHVEIHKDTLFRFHDMAEKRYLNKLM